MLTVVRVHPAFRRVFLAHSISRAGDAFNTVALVVLVFRLTGSGLGVAGMVIFEVVPFLVFGPVAGLVADRLPRRAVMVGADLGRAALVSVLAVSHSSVALAYGSAFGLAIGSLAFNPAAQSLVPETVPEDDVVRANAALWTAAVVAQIALAPVAGVLVAAVGVGPALAVNAASFVASAAVLVGLPVGREPTETAVTGWRGLGAGLSVVRNDGFLTRLLVVQVLAALSAGATSGLLVVLAAESLEVGPSGFGLLLMAIGAGAALGPAVFSRRIGAGHRGWLFGPLALRGVVDLVLAASASPALAGPALVAYGVGTSTGTVAFQSTLQHRVPGRVRGRTLALYDQAWQGSRLVSLAAGGLLADVAGIRAVYVAGAVVLFVAVLVGWAPGGRTGNALRMVRGTS